MCVFKPSSCCYRYRYRCCLHEKTNIGSASNNRTPRGLIGLDSKYWKVTKFSLNLLKTMQKHVTFTSTCMNLCIKLVPEAVGTTLYTALEAGGPKSVPRKVTFKNSQRCRRKVHVQPQTGRNRSRDGSETDSSRKMRQDTPKIVEI